MDELKPHARRKKREHDEDIKEVPRPRDLNGRVSHARPFRDGIHHAEKA
jgi:hypothetical protein